MSNLSKTKLLEMYRAMQDVRLFDLKVNYLVKRGMVPGMTHLSVGEEAANIGAIAALNTDDYITSNHRGHAQVIGKGIDLNAMMAEIMGKATGVCKGKGGSMHIADIINGNLGANGIVGGGHGISVGAALTQKYNESDKVVVCFFGEGASNEGSFHEAVNMASVWKVPVIFYVINNGYAISTSQKKSTRSKRISARADVYNMNSYFIEDGNDVIAVYETFSKAVDEVRKTKKPLLVESKTYRWFGHSSSDAGKYRSKEEVDSWKKKDPLLKLRNYLLEEGIATEAELDAQDAESKQKVEESVVFAQNSAPPTYESAFEDVYAPSPADGKKDESKSIYEQSEKKVMSVKEAVNLAMSEEMRRDPSVFLMGEDVGIFGGDFGTSVGMLEEFGEERVRDTPISEGAISGTAVGSAMTGLRPIVDVTFMDFIMFMMDNIVNQAAKARYMFGGKVQVPVTFRCAAGSGIGSAAQHSQSLESWFCHIPGLKVVAPGTPADVKGLLKAAIRDNNPVIFLEYKAQYNMKGEVPLDENYVLPLGKADIKRAGKDITIVTYGRMLERVMKAAEVVEAEGIDVEVVDLRTLLPLDKDAVINSVKKTGKVLLVNDAYKTGGFIGELSAIISESEAFSYLDAPIVRLASEDIPVPYNHDLENAIVPTVEKITKAIKQLAKNSI